MSGLVLITGGAGFIGSHLAKALIASGQGVRILDSFEPQVHSQDSLPITGADVLRGNVIDPRVWDLALEGATHVVHFASAVGVGQSMYRIADYCRTNVLGTAYLLEAVARRKNTVARLLVASSMSIYGEGFYWCDHCKRAGNSERRQEALAAGRWELECSGCQRQLLPSPTPESKTLRPSSVYSINKRDQEEMCLVVGRAYGISTIALRFFNVYGPGQSLRNPYTGVAAMFAARLLERVPPLVFEDGRQSRDFVHVTDIVNACICALQRTEVVDIALNVGTGRATSVGQLAVILQGLLGGPSPRFLETFRPGDIRHCFADISAIRAALGWEPSISLERGMADLGTWLSTQSGDRTGLERAHGELRDLGLIR